MFKDSIWNLARQFLNERAEQPERWWEAPGFVASLGFAMVMAVVWWGVSFRLQDTAVIVWADQTNTFYPSVSVIQDPFVLIGFVHPVWVTLLLTPFTLFPLTVSILIQGIIYYTSLAAVIYKFGGNRGTVLTVFTAYVAFDAMLQLNIDWFVVVGMLIPIALSPIFVLTKPQIGLGYYLGLPLRRSVVAGFVGLLILAATWTYWGNWPLVLLEKAQVISVAQDFNIAPSEILSWYVSIPIGIALALVALRRQDVPLGILAWLFFTPYIAHYSLLLPFAMLAIRFRSLAILISVLVWIIYGTAFVYMLIR